MKQMSNVVSLSSRKRIDEPVHPVESKPSKRTGARPRASGFGSPPAQEHIVTQWDDVVPGCGIRTNRQGGQQFIAKIRHEGKQRWFTLGPVGMFTVDEARQLVKNMKLLSKAGTDPKGLIDQVVTGKLLPKRSITFGAFVRFYIEHYAQIHKASWLKDQQRLNLYLLPIWCDKPLAQITRLEVLKVHQDIGKTRPIAANRLLEVITVMWKQAKIMGFLPESHPDVTLGVKRFKQTSRDRFLSDDEWQRLLRALDEVKGDSMQKAIIRLDLELGFRSKELLTLKWEYVDLDRKEIRLPKTKNGKSFRQPLTENACRILAALPRQNQWVFASERNPGHHVTSFCKLLKRVCKHAGIEDFRPHDIRRSVGCSVLSKTGSLEMVAAVLNHTSLETTRIYARYAREHVRIALETHSRTRRIESAEVNL